MSIPGARALAACTALVVSLSLAACGTGESGSSGASSESGGVKAGPGVDVASKTIRVGNLTALTGTIAVLGTQLTAAYDAYFQSLNARGGIDGWKVELVTRDTANVPASHVRAFNEIRGDIALLSSIGSPGTKAIQQAVDQEKLVTQPTSFNTAWGLDPVLAPLNTPYGIEVMNAIDYQVSENGAQGKKFALFYQNDEFGKDGLRGYEAVVEELGLESVAEVTYKPEDTDFTAQVQRLRSAGAEVVMLTAAPAPLAGVIGTGASQGYNPTWIAQSLGFTPQIVSDDGTVDGKRTPVADALARETFTAAVATPANELPDTAAYEQLRADTEKYAPEQKELLPYYVTGYAYAKVADAILRKAIRSGDLTREGILNAKTSLGTVDLQGLTADVTYQAEPGPPSRDSAIGRLTLDDEGFLQVLNQSYTSETARNFDITTIDE